MSAKQRAKSAAVRAATTASAKKPGIEEASDRKFVAVHSEFEKVPEDDSGVIKRHSRSFSFASRMLGQKIRSDVQKLYAWCRWCDDAVDSAESRSVAVEQLATLRHDVELIYEGKAPNHPASLWLAELVAKHDLDRSYPMALLEGMEIDLHLGQIESEADLLQYCYHAAGVVGLMMCQIFGVKERGALRHAEALGIAMQLTNIARDVKEDQERGRCYLPKTWLESSNADEKADSGAMTRSAVKRLLELADRYYAIGNQGILFLPKNVRPAIRIAAAVYREIGIEIQRNDYRVLSGRTVVPKWRFLMAALRGLFQSNANRQQALCFSKIDRKPNTIQLSLNANFSEAIMNDAKYIIYLGLSLTSFMACALFLMVMVNPKDDVYSTLPIFYSVGCFVVGVITNLLAKKAEGSGSKPVDQTI